MTQKELLNLLKQMTLDEKIFQLSQLTGNFYAEKDMSLEAIKDGGAHKELVENAGSTLNVFVGTNGLREVQKRYLEQNRNKIPLLFMADLIHGCKTIFPIPLALGCTWNPDLVEECMAVVAKEAAAMGVHCTFSPMVDLSRDPRWGRVMESPGEDPYLNSLISAAFVKGFQGDLSPSKSIASCVKHFAAYGAVEGGRDYNTVDMSERRLRQDYLPAYKAAIDAGCTLLMTSFNTVDGIPSSGNKWLMRDVLREEWGFKGVTISDYSANQELINHGVAEDEREAAKLSIEAGVDIEMASYTYPNHLKDLLSKGEITEEIIDEAVLRVLELKNKLGLFEDPYRGVNVENESEVFLTKESRKLARKAASKSAVLLKNENKVLPIKKEQKVALLGAYADDSDIGGAITLKEVMTKSANVLYAKGCEMLEDYSVVSDSSKKAFDNVEHEKTLAEAVEVAKKSDVVVIALGEHASQCGEAASRTDITLPKIQLDLIDRVSELGKDIVLVLFSGRPLILTNVIDKVSAVIQAWFPGTEGSLALADILYGDVNPSGKLSMSFPYAIGQIPVYYNSFNTGRPKESSSPDDWYISKYLDCPNTPLYPFGYGLSYTSYEYSNLKLDKNQMSKHETIAVAIDVSNTGEVSGEETVQLYLRDLVASVARPVKELKAFAKVILAPGETKTISFKIDEGMLRFYTKDMSFKSELGKFKVFVGGSSIAVLESEFKLV